MSEENNNNDSGNKWSFERIILILALGGNIGLGGVGLFSGEKQQNVQPTTVSESCDFKLTMCEWKLKETEEKCKK